MKEMMAGYATDGQVGAFLASLTLDKCTTNVVAALADEMRKSALPFDGSVGALDIVGTGGDGQNTFNISTAASFIIAAAGVPVMKHGNNQHLHGLGVQTCCWPWGPRLPSTQ